MSYHYNVFGQLEIIRKDVIERYVQGSQDQFGQNQNGQNQSSKGEGKGQSEQSLGGQDQNGQNQNGQNQNGQNQSSKGEGKGQSEQSLGGQGQNQIVQNQSSKGEGKGQSEQGQSEQGQSEQGQSEQGQSSLYQGSLGPVGFNKKYPIYNFIDYTLNEGIKNEKDILGFDLSEFPIKDSSIEMCNESCKNDSNCDFWVFNKDNQNCSLKKVNASIDSSVFFKDGNTGLFLNASDIPGFDQKSYGMYAPSALSCMNQCISDPNCDFSTYNTNSKLCYQKTAVTDTDRVLGFPYKSK